MKQGNGYLCSMIFADCTSYFCGQENIKIIMQMLVSAFFAILFLQSGFDKISDRKGNLAWMAPHFEKSPLKGMVPFLFTIITLLELAAGTLSLAGIAVLLIRHCDYWMFWGNLFSAVSLLCLFFGQRLAKDYAGAQSLVSYFIVALAGLWLCCG